jgi:hypothetical protein
MGQHHRSKTEAALQHGHPPPVLVKHTSELLTAPHSPVSQLKHAEESQQEGGLARASAADHTNLHTSTPESEQDSVYRQQLPWQGITPCHSSSLCLLYTSALLNKVSVLLIT